MDKIQVVIEWSNLPPTVAYRICASIPIKTAASIQSCPKAASVRSRIKSISSPSSCRAKDLAMESVARAHHRAHSFSTCSWWSQWRLKSSSFSQRSALLGCPSSIPATPSANALPLSCWQWTLAALGKLCVQMLKYTVHLGKLHSPSHLHEVWEELNVGVLSSWKLQSQWLASLGKAHIKNRERHRVNEVLAHVGFYPIHHLRMLASENQRIKEFFGGSRLWSCSVTLRISRPVTTDIA